MTTNYTHESIITYFKSFSDRQINSSKYVCKIGSFAIVINNMANKLIKLAHKKDVLSDYNLEQQLFKCGSDLIKTFAEKNNRLPGFGDMEKQKNF